MSDILKPTLAADSVEPKHIGRTQDVASRGTCQIKGRFIGIRGILAQGWAYNANNPDEPVSVELLNGERPIASAVANLLREDTTALIEGNTRCGFRIRLPNALLDGRELELRVREAASGTDLESEVAPLVAPEHPGWSAAITDLEGQVLTGQLEIESVDTEQDLELELWIDGIWADRFHVAQPGKDQDLIPFRHPIPESVRDGDAWTSVLDGENHEFLLTPADTSLMLAAAVFPTPVKSYTYTAIQTNPAASLDQLPRSVRCLIARAASSALFDRAYYAARAKEDLPTSEHAVLHYLSDRRHWRLATSPWMDLPFINALAGDLTKEQVSPLEWYLRQGPDSDVGPNPWFSNADYCVFAGYPPNGRPRNASYFDDWLESATGPAPVNPSALIDLPYLKKRLGAGVGPSEERVLEYLKDWVQTRPKDRPIDKLGPYFDQDWLEQCFILRHNRPKRCQLTAFRLGLLTDQSPHPVLQHGREGRDYYALIRDYERLRFAHGIDDIIRVCPEIDGAAFYAQFPRQPQGVKEAADRSSSF
jgi:hypothetical protein